MDYFHFKIKKFEQGVGVCAKTTVETNAWSSPCFPFINQPDQKFPKSLSDYGPNAVKLINPASLEKISESIAAAAKRVSADELEPMQSLFEKIKNPPQCDGLHWADGGRFKNEILTKEQMELEKDLHKADVETRREFELNIRPHFRFYHNETDHKNDNETLAAEEIV